MVNLISSLFAGYNSALVRSLGMSIDTNEGLAIGKLYDTLLVVLPIIALTKMSGADLGSLFLRRGDWKWGLEVGALVLFNFLTSVLITLGLACGYLMLRTGSIWGSVLIHAAADWFLFIAVLATH